MQTSKKFTVAYDQTENTFSFKKKNKEISYTILDHEIQTLRPITLLEDGTKLILVYLPIQETIIEKDGNQETNFEQKAFFVIKKPDGSKRVLPYNNNDLTEHYKISVIPNGFLTRWNLADFNKWKKDEKTNPEELYELLKQTAKHFLDFKHDYDYTFFTLWNIGTYFYELFDAYPYLDFTGTKRAGKTKALTFQELVCFNSMLTSDVSGSATFRAIEGYGSSFQLDESEFFKSKKNEQAQHVRTLLLEGFLKNKYAMRAEKSTDDSYKVSAFNLYGPKSLGHIKALDDVLQDRCIDLLMIRAKDKEKLNSWPSKEDKRFSQIRNLCYRLFLDYAEEIKDLQFEARNKLSISGRELQLWTPLITLALFFENHNVYGLIDKIKEKTKVSSKERQIQDEQAAIELKVVRFLEEVCLTISQSIEKQEERKNNPQGWMPVGVMMKYLEEYGSHYDINLDYFKRSHLTEVLRRLDLKQERKEGGYSWYLDNKILLEIKERLGMTSGSEGSEGSEGSAVGTDPTNKTEVTEQTELTE